ncbi:hypothetical protein BDV96DRAFT_482547 [Lophiotrema nucula]|uniref:Protein SQS1 n=1 Tax=Lophiotrema nucula TaxID=690887 RepID=A0A6A5ZQI9_9PLEO|nr:hypothetical protein BDV96DRAFT_482547 [Lophiotrema nucula]
MAGRPQSPRPADVSLANESRRPRTTVGRKKVCSSGACLLDTSIDAFAALPQFSMRDEARFLASHRSRAFDTGRKLRLERVEFVSAGLLEGTIKEKEPPREKQEADHNNAPSEESTTASPAMEKMAIRSPSPSLSSSSEEVVLFRGRGGVSLTHSTEACPAPTKRTSTQKSSEKGNERNVADQQAHPVSVSVSVDAKSQSQPGVPPLDSQTETQSDGESVVDDGFTKRLGGQSKWMTNTTPWVHRSKPGIGWLPPRDRPDMNAFLRGDVNPADLAMEDYMQNIQDFLPEQGNGTPTQNTFSTRPLDMDGDGDDQIWARDSVQVSTTFQAVGGDSDWDSHALADLEGFSTSSDVLDKIERILATRKRKSGVQYLVVYEGSIPDDARWLPKSFLTTPSDLKLLEEFHAEVLLRESRYPDDADSDSEIDSDDDDGDDDDDSDNTDVDVGDIDDEQYARILQKQEELGLGSDELLLYAHDQYFAGPVKPTRSGPIDRPHKRRQRRSGMEPTFPSASAMADVLDIDPYNGFDVMDTERPSLRPRKKGRRGQAPPELSDEDLNEQLQSTWAADRTKKRLKKAEREELRKQGLLGRKGKAPDLSVKYQSGFTMDQIVEEIREFMASDTQTFSLPPMDAGQRAAVHQFVHELGVNSKSRGDGMHRFTVLSKTSRTKRFNDEYFDALVDKKKFKIRLQGSARGDRFPKGKKTRPATVGYKDGDTVGASAPELGPENRGHALLAKMGWTRGTALGALDNKGILVPIPHTVKVNKAGLQ